MKPIMPVTPPPAPVDTVKPVEEPKVAATPEPAKEKPVKEKKKKPVKEPKMVVNPKAKETTHEIESDSVRITAPILFEINKAGIRPESKPLIAEAIAKIKNNPDAYIVVEGYTDTTGPVSYNKVLSKMRANVLKQYLIENGVSPDKIKSVGLGASAPAADNKTRSGRMKNRRAEMKWGK